MIHNLSPAPVYEGANRQQAVIYVNPEVAAGRPLSKLRSGNNVGVCAARGEVVALVEADEWSLRNPFVAPSSDFGLGRASFALLSDGAEQGASASLARVGL